MKCVMSEEEFLLKWNNHQTNFVDVFNELLRDESFVDVTLVCGGEAVPGHKMVLAACSPLLHRILRDNPCKHPLVILSDVPARDMRAMMKFIYQGEVSVSQTELASFLKTADNLQIKGLAEDKEKEKEERKRKDKDGDKTEGRVSNKRQRTAEPRTTENSSPLPSRSHKALNDSHSSSHKSRSKASAEEHTPRVGGGGLHMPASKHNSSKNSSSKSPRDIPSRVSNASEENSLQHAVNNNSVTEDVLPKEEMTVKTEPLDYPGEMVWTEGHGTIKSDILEDPQSLMPLAAIPGALEGVAAALAASPNLPVMESGEDSRGDMSTASDELNSNAVGGTWVQGSLAQGTVRDSGTVPPPSLVPAAAPLPPPVTPAAFTQQQLEEPQQLQPPLPSHASPFRASTITLPLSLPSTTTVSAAHLERLPDVPSSSAPPQYFTTTITTNNNNSAHKCRQCSFVTSNPYTFTRHLRIHLGTKEFRCRVCAFASSRKDSLIRHFRMKHLTGEMSVYHDLDSRDIEELALVRGVPDSLRLRPNQF
ncbi:protein tramtrack, beta isoform-like isoform X1 [Penaeus indicus]|uniref:protein tramtrack, beta isoform-like isoform X1 n=2 Tax=Penaeus indicus TaxID=29960 RepID=UPI00300CBA5B